MSFQRAITFAQQLIRIPSLPGQEGELAGRVLTELKALRFDDVWQDEAGNSFARVKGRHNAPPVMLNSHLDMVDVGDAAAWQIPPFEGRVADGFLHGRGAMDIKGPLALQTYAAARFLTERPAGDLLLGFTVYEEKGGWGMQHLLEQGEIRPAAVILGEATNGNVCIGHRGRAELVVELGGVAAHASAPERARNPIDLLPLVLPRLAEFARTLPDHPVLGASTIAPTSLETLPNSRNVIPDIVRIVLDWRVLPEITADSAVELVRAAFHDLQLEDGFSLDVRLNVEPQRTYTGLERQRRMFTPGYLIASDHPVVRAAAAAIIEATGNRPQLRPWTFATDGGHACGVHGIPCIGYAPGEERYAHTTAERLDLRHAELCFDVYPGVIRSVQAALK